MILEENQNQHVDLIENYDPQIMVMDSLHSQEIIDQTMQILEEVYVIWEKSMIELSISQYKYKNHHIECQSGGITCNIMIIKLLSN